MTKTQGDTELIHAVRTNDYNKVENLINEKDIYINERGRWGNTALHYAYNRGNIKIILLLLRNGANPHKCHDYNQTPEEHSSIASYTYIKNEYEIESAKNEYINSLELSLLDLGINVYIMLFYQIFAIFVMLSFPFILQKRNRYIRLYSLKQIMNGMTSDLYN